MRVTISVRGRFHAFEMAAQLHARGYLDRLITSYPAFAIDAWAVPRDRVKALPAHEAASRLWRRAPDYLQRHIDLQYAFHDAFDRHAYHHIPAGSNLYVGWSGFSERGLHRARDLGAVTVLERGSAHIETQRELLREEYERWNLRPVLPHPGVVDKEKREYDLADFVSVPSSFARRTFVERGIPTERLITIPLGVDTGLFQPRSSRDRIFRVVYAGAMTLQKGVPYLLQAFAELHLPNAELWLVGSRSPELEGVFQKYQGTFRHFDSVPESQLAEIYARCSAFVLCSIHDGFGMVLTQAMASGLPVIATENTGGPDVVRHGVDGFVIPIRSVDSLKTSLLQLYEDREQCRTMGEEAARSIGARFTWDAYGRSIASSYLSILSKRSTSGTESVQLDGDPRAPTEAHP